MKKLSELLAFSSAIAICVATAVSAQETAPSEAPSDLSLGQDVNAQDQIGAPYTREKYGAWDVRCIKTEDGNDPCQLYQLIVDENDNSVAEISLFALPEGQQAVAGATIATPLETLLTRQITMSVDAGVGKLYPFSYCSLQGCFARVGFTADDLAAFKKGVDATISIVPIAAPDSVVSLKLSLSGFTAGYKAVGEANAANAN